ncbi:hypothetical protein HWV00_11140 [Moritella sp. 24]|uniref:hypothetical protein n=1 Tax=Moritella sp. 24 TaxID=2746230 RepID=UPI001BA7E0C3|nr:hypothetical protein [Moritella sp. 24]QUM76741.1 hypothetical protein HWV00_11140 [Moritella sp. 24]
MSQYILDNLLPILGGSGAVVIALSSWLGKVSASRIIEKEKSELNLELQKVKDENKLILNRLDAELQKNMQNKEHHYQVSKSTYEMIFDKRVSVYGELLELKNSYYKYINEHPLSETEDGIEESFTYFMKCRGIIELNKIYVSEELITKYSIWYDLALDSLVKLGKDGYKAHGQAHSDVQNFHNVHDAQFPARNKLVIDTKDSMELLFKQVEFDLQRIRKTISHSLCF